MKMDLILTQGFEFKTKDLNFFKSNFELNSKIG
jgi:hypothetical protein